MIATVVLQLTYRSLLSRGVNKKSDDNFYSSESALDDIETVLQNIAVNSINSVQSDSSGNTTFINAAQAALVNVTGASDVSSLDNTQISEYIFNQLDSDTKAILGSAVEAGGTTTYVYYYS
jgi:cell division GTPase FtsZ